MDSTKFQMAVSANIPKSHLEHEMDKSVLSYLNAIAF